MVAAAHGRTCAPAACVIRGELTRRFRALLSDSRTGVPDWTPLVAVGDDEGFFGPADEAWIVHSDLATMIGGIRALLMQALHPGSLAGVVQHSRYESDVLGRLNGTIRWLTISTFGSSTAIEAEAARVRALHERVRGSYKTTHGETRHYRASDVDLLQWVHVAFTDSFLKVHQHYGQQSIDADAYVAGWARAVEPLGLHDAPSSAAALERTIASYNGELRVDETTRKVVAFIRKVAFPRGARPVYRLLFAAAVETLPAEYRQLLGLRAAPAPLVRISTRMLLRLMRWIIGQHSPMELVALERRARVAASSGVGESVAEAG